MRQRHQRCAHKILPLRDFLLTALLSIPNTRTRFGDVPFSPVRGTSSVKPSPFHSPPAICSTAISGLRISAERSQGRTECTAPVKKSGNERIRKTARTSIGHHAAKRPVHRAHADMPRHFRRILHGPRYGLWTRWLLHTLARIELDLRRHRDGRARPPG